MTNSPNHITDAPAALSTARRPGQPGEETEHRAGPNPRSANPTGPHAPYEPGDPNGLAAEKHVREPAGSTDHARGAKAASNGIEVVDLSRHKT